MANHLLAGSRMPSAVLAVVEDKAGQTLLKGLMGQHVQSGINSLLRYDLPLQQMHRISYISN